MDVMLNKLLFRVMRYFKIIPVFSGTILSIHWRSVYFINTLSSIVMYLNQSGGREEVEKFMEYEVKSTAKRVKQLFTVDLYLYCLVKHLQFSAYGAKVKWKFDGNQAIGTINECTLKTRFAKCIEKSVEEYLPCTYCIKFNTLFAGEFGFKAVFIRESCKCTSIIRDGESLFKKTS